MTADAPEGVKTPRGARGGREASLSGRPEMPRLGRLEVRLAETPADIEAAQRLRYKVFYEEMQARATPEMKAQGRDFDRFDALCDHMIVIDHEAPKGEEVVGTYRCLRQDVAEAHGGFYTQDEFDLQELIDRLGPEIRFLELGRSCVHADYRTKPMIELLWVGIISYVNFYGLDVMVGCASLHGTDPNALALPLSYLYHNYLAPEPWRARAREHRYVAMDRVPKHKIDAREAFRMLPPLIKGYLRAGCYIGDGAVVDEQFNTIDVMIILPVSVISDRYYARFTRGRNGKGGNP
jgi:L-ornithine Nalpha-acyltransferase